jgi:hypothetical protein
VRAERTSLYVSTERRKRNNADKVCSYAVRFSIAAELRKKGNAVGEFSKFKEEKK